MRATRGARDRRSMAEMKTASGYNKDRASRVSAERRSILFRARMRGMLSMDRSRRDGFHGFELGLHLRMRGVGDVDQDIGAFQLLQGGHEGLAQIGRQVADEAHGIGQNDLTIFGVQPAAGWIEGGKELVLGQDVALGQGVEQVDLPALV